MSGARAEVLHGQPSLLISAVARKLSRVTNCSRQVVLIGRDGLSKQRQSGIAIAARQVAQDLVVGAVFLEDVRSRAGCPRAPPP